MKRDREMVVDAFGRLEEAFRDGERVVDRDLDALRTRQSQARGTHWHVRFWGWETAELDHRIARIRIYLNLPLDSCTRIGISDIRGVQVFLNVIWVVPL